MQLVASFHNAVTPSTLSAAEMSIVGGSDFLCAAGAGFGTVMSIASLFGCLACGIAGLVVQIGTTAFCL